MTYITMRGAKGNSISSLVIVSMCVMCYTSSACHTIRKAEIQVNLPEHSHGCDAISRQPSRRNLDSEHVLGPIRTSMQERWTSSENSDCYLFLNKSRANFTFLARNVSCQITDLDAQKVQFQCDYNFTDFCPVFFIVGYKAWTKTLVYTSSMPAELNCAPTRHHTGTIGVFALRRESSYNVEIECVGDVPCLQPEMRLMFLMYKNTHEENYGDLRSCM